MWGRTRTFAASPSGAILRQGAVALLALGALLLTQACSAAPQAPPGGEAASKAARAAGEAYAKSLRRPIERGRGDRAQADLDALRRALEQHAADRSSYPEASSCVDLAAALADYRTPVPERDPWGGAYECRSSEGGYSLRSAGEDGRMGTGDDIVVEGGTP
jgi:hypothetical protein